MIEIVALGETRVRSTAYLVSSVALSYQRAIFRYDSHTLAKCTRKVNTSAVLEKITYLHE